MIFWDISTSQLARNRYNRHGRPDAITTSYISAYETISYGFLLSAEPHKIFRNGVPISQQWSNAKGQIIHSAAANGTQTIRQYDSITLRLKAIKVIRANGNVLMDRGYTYDLLGNIVAVSHEGSNMPWLYTYDSLYRLVTATGTERGKWIDNQPWNEWGEVNSSYSLRAFSESYEYDKIGFMTRQQHVGTNPGTNTNYTRTKDFTRADDKNALQEVTTGGNTYTFTYDTAGNLIGQGDNRVYKWDYRNMLVRFDIVASGSISLTGYYCYDHTGNRLKKIVKNQQGNLDVTTYIGSMERRTSISGTTTTTKVAGLADFQRGNHPEEWNKDVWHTTDHLGTVTLHLSNQGYVLKKSYYTPFGETAGTEDSKSRYRYCGKEKDGESGLYYYGARYYAAWLCRFVSVDPLGEKYAQLSSYNYCKNSPQNYVDRDGKEPIRIFLIPLSIPIIIVSSTKPKKPSQWYEFNYITDQESFNEAAEYNTKHLNHEAYQSVFQRNDYYEWADSKLKGYGVRWFGAAEIVTRYDSVGGAEFPDFGAFTSSEVDSFLKEGNKYLFSQNIENTKKIIEGKGKLDLNFTDAKGALKSTKGKLGHDLDNLLVEFEQSKLQEFIGKYKSTVSSSEWGSMINEINSLFTSPLAQSDVKSAIENLFPKGGINGSFNFLNYDHRVLLGKYLVEKLHATDTPKPKSN